MLRACFTKPTATHAHWQFDNVINVAATKRSNIERKINSTNIDKLLSMSEENKEESFLREEDQVKNFQY